MGRPKGMKMTEEHKQRISEGRRRGLEQKARAARATQRAELKVAARGASVSAAPKPPAFIGRDAMIDNARQAIAANERILHMLGARKQS